MAYYDVLLWHALNIDISSTSINSMKCRNQNKFQLLQISSYEKCCQYACSINFNSYSSWMQCHYICASKRKSLVMSLLHWWRIGGHYTHTRSVSLLVHRVQFVITRVILPVKPPGKNRVLRGGDLSCSLVSARWKGLHYSSVRRAMGGVYLTFIRREARRLSVRVPLSIISFRLRKRTYASS